MVDIALCEEGRQLKSQRMELNQVNQLTDQAQGEKMLAICRIWETEHVREVAQKIVKKLRITKNVLVKKRIKPDT